MTQDDVIWWRKMCHWDSVIFEELVPHLNRYPKICSFLFIFVHFFAHKQLVPRLNRYPKICSLLFTFNFSFASKVPVPHLNIMAQISIFSVHFCWSDLASPSNLPNCLNPSPDCNSSHWGLVSCIILESMTIVLVDYDFWGETLSSVSFILVF